jgi:hypothetical protein
VQEEAEATVDVAAVLAQDAEAVEEVQATLAQQVHPRKVCALSMNIFDYGTKGTADQMRTSWEKLVQ